METNSSLKTVVINMRTTKEVKQMVQKMARNDSRSLSMEIEYLIKKEFKSRESESK